MKIELEDFDMKFFNSLADKDKIMYNSKGVYHTIMVDGEKAGIVGYIALVSEEKGGFVQIILDKKFRGKGIVEKAEDLLVGVYGLEVLYATIEEENIASLKSHLKLGFKVVAGERLKYLWEKKLLKKNETRLVKKYV